MGEGEEGFGGAVGAGGDCEGEGVWGWGEDAGEAPVGEDEGVAGGGRREEDVGGFLVEVRGGWGLEGGEGRVVRENGRVAKQERINRFTPWHSQYHDALWKRHARAPALSQSAS